MDDKKVELYNKMDVEKGEIDVVKLCSSRFGRVSTNCDFNWFSFSQRVFDGRFYIIVVAPSTQFYCEPSGRTLTPSGLSKKEGDKVTHTPAKLLILDEPHNERELSEMGLDVGSCPTLKCRLLEGAAFAMKKLKLDGAVIRSPESPKKTPSFLCDGALFAFRNGILQQLEAEKCEIVRYAKRNNTKLQIQIAGFPSCSKIDEMLEKMTCQEVSKEINRLLRGI